MSLLLYNTLTRKKEEFTPLHKDHVGMYVCGPTVYGHSHIGHAKSYVSFDVIVRYLRFKKYKVTYVQNITDVGHLLGDTDEGEDRLIKQSNLEHKHPMEIAEFYTRSYFEDMDALGVLRPDISPRATGHVIEQIELIKSLIEAGFAYEAGGSVYFDVSRDSNYGKLSGRSTEEVESGKRVKAKSEKRHPNDFALWKKASREHIMRWPSPWGVGFPGWHIECSAMSMKYLGETVDIHGGGLDNQFPHHECEIAQSESATGKPFVRYWIHNNLVTVNGKKMSKSLGNVVLLKDLFKKYDPLVIRYFILQSHYRSTLDFSEEALEGASKGLQKLLNTRRKLRDQLAHRSVTSSTYVDQPFDGYRTSILEALDDDFNAPQAIARLFDFASQINGWLSGGFLSSQDHLRRIYDCFMELGGDILGIIPRELESHPPESAGLESGLIELIIDLRSEIRAQKLWALSDTIRDRLQQLGIIVEDTKDGVSWRRGKS